MRVAAAAAARSRKGVSILLCSCEGFCSILAREVESVCRKKTAKISFGKWVFFLAEFLVFKMKANIWVISEGTDQKRYLPDENSNLYLPLVLHCHYCQRKGEKAKVFVFLQFVKEAEKEMNDQNEESRGPRGKKPVTVCPLVLPLRFWSLCFRYLFCWNIANYVDIVKEGGCWWQPPTLTLVAIFVEEEMSLAATIDDKGARGAAICRTMLNIVSQCAYPPMSKDQYITVPDSAHQMRRTIRSHGENGVKIGRRTWPHSPSLSGKLVLTALRRAPRVFFTRMS
ncbi:hypothetical protein NC651_009848 [Populus alba x Populus x berolinensis]|nr:hypothetical protein NC651_009848 [Populus alba x Populus x berolinensis]